MILSDPNVVFKGAIYYSASVNSKVIYDIANSYSYNGILIESHIWSIEWRHFK